MSQLLRRASQLVVVGCAAGTAGWVLGHNRTSSPHTLLAGQPHTLPPIFETVQAAAIQGSVVNVEPPDVLPQPAPNAPRISQVVISNCSTVYD